MAETQDDSSKTEQPSHRKLSRARDRGQVIQSREINTLFMLSAGAVVVLLMAPSLAARMTVTLARFLDPAQLIAGGGILWPAVFALLGEVAQGLILPVLLLVAAAIAGSLIQTGLVFAVDKIGFDASRLSPIAGFQRLFSLRSGLEFLKNLAKVALVMAVSAMLLLPELRRLPALVSSDIATLSAEIEHLLLRFLLGVLVLVASLALLDYGYQRLSFMRQMRMSKQEVKEEYKQAEGDPTIKARLRQIRMERARRRMMAAVPSASVVVTNPTHYAVALKYEMGSKGAPRVVAKGADLIARRIREIAEENDVPLVENPPLARALYANVELDHEIPPEHYKAVAEIISYVFRLKGKRQPR
jgi:flagellar biosynthetic protein FlhB